MNGMGCTGEAGQTSKVGQFLKVHQCTLNKPYIQFVELMEASGL